MLLAILFLTAVYLLRTHTAGEKRCPIRSGMTTVEE